MPDRTDGVGLGASLAARLLAFMNGHMAAPRAFLAAGHPTIADLACYGYVAHAPEGGIPLDSYPAVRAWLGRVGYDPVYGARPLKRAVQKYLQDPLADRILSGEVKDGQTVRVDEGDGGLVIKPVERLEAAA